MFSGFSLQRLLVLVFISISVITCLTKSFSHARQVVGTNAVPTPAEFELAGKSNVAIRKGNFDAVPSAAEVEKMTAVRKMTSSKRLTIVKKGSMKVSSSSSDVRNRKTKGSGADNWKDNVMAFSADYRSPKSHPPRNN